jgi:hypothetical protein
MTSNFYHAILWYDDTWLYLPMIPIHIISYLGSEIDARPAVPWSICRWPLVAVWGFGWRILAACSTTPVCTVHTYLHNVLIIWNYMNDATLWGIGCPSGEDKFIPGSWGLISLPRVCFSPVHCSMGSALSEVGLDSTGASFWAWLSLTISTIVNIILCSPAWWRLHRLARPFIRSPHLACRWPAELPARRTQVT